MEKQSRHWEGVELTAFIMATKALRQLAIVSKLSDQQLAELNSKLKESNVESMDTVKLCRDQALKVLESSNPPVFVKHSSISQEPVVRSYKELEELASQIQNGSAAGKLAGSFLWWPTNFRTALEFARYRESHIEEILD
jgi:hypothetical protein